MVSKDYLTILIKKMQFTKNYGNRAAFVKPLMLCQWQIVTFKTHLLQSWRQDLPDGTSLSGLATRSPDKATGCGKTANQNFKAS